MPELKRYHLPGEFEEIVLEPVTPIKTPAMWNGVFTARNMDALELVIAGLHTFGAHDLADEMQLLYTQGSLMRPT